MKREQDEKTKLFLDFFDGIDIHEKLDYAKRPIIDTIIKKGRCGSFLSLDDMKRLYTLYRSSVSKISDIMNYIANYGVEYALYRGDTDGLNNLMRMRKDRLSYYEYRIRNYFFDFLFMTRGSFPNAGRAVRSIDAMSMFTVSLLRSMFGYSPDTIMPFNVSSKVSNITKKQELLNTLDAFEHYQGRKADDDTIDALVAQMIYKYIQQDGYSLSPFSLFPCNNSMIVELTYMDKEHALQYWTQLDAIHDDMINLKNNGHNMKNMNTEERRVSLRGLVANQSLSTEIFDRGMDMVMNNHYIDMLEPVYTYNDNMESIPFSMIIDTFEKVEPTDDDFESAFESIAIFNKDSVDGTIHVTENIIINLLFASIIGRKKALAWIYLQFFTFMVKYKNSSDANRKSMGRVMTFRKGEMDKDFLEYMSSLPYDFVKEEFLRRIKDSNTVT